MSDKPERRTIVDLLEIMAALRTPGTGCPWDLEQSFETIAPYTIEEAYEVADAIERKDMADLKDELGDLLLQVVYHAQMASEAGLFDFGDVVEAVCDKMVRRHPHVFGDMQIADSEELDGLWQRIKAEEKANRSGGQSEAGVLDGVPRALPALTRAIKLQNKAARVGFDWPDRGPVLAKMREELAEFEEALAANGDRSEPDEDVMAEYGDLLFVIANLARHLGFDPETALSGTNAKFVRRFERIEVLVKDDGHSVTDLDLAQLDHYWERVKVEEQSEGS